uniref:Uncharacterized protein n=1 Tax=Romanomermis culicivorax TaxID=13658 RepID=A0A915JMW6_ROMCU
MDHLTTREAVVCITLERFVNSSVYTLFKNRFTKIAGCTLASQARILKNCLSPVNTDNVAADIVEFGSLINKICIPFLSFKPIPKCYSQSEKMALEKLDSVGHKQTDDPNIRVNQRLVINVILCSALPQELQPIIKGFRRMATPYTINSLSIFLPDYTKNMRTWKATVYIQYSNFFSGRKIRTSLSSRFNLPSTAAPTVSVVVPAPVLVPAAFFLTSAFLLATAFLLTSTFFLAAAFFSAALFAAAAVSTVIPAIVVIVPIPLAFDQMVRNLTFVFVYNEGL